MKKFLRILGTIIVYGLTLVIIWATSKIDSPDRYTFVQGLLPAVFMDVFYPILMAGLILTIWESDPAFSIVEWAVTRYLKIFFTLIVTVLTGGAFFMVFQGFSHNWPPCFELFVLPQALILIVAAGLIMFIWREEIFSSTGDKHSLGTNTSKTE